MIKFYKILVNTLCVFFVNIAICQENIFTITKDSLYNKSFEELNDLSGIAFNNNDTVSLKIYRAYHLKKAKTEKNNLEIARAYYSYISWGNLEEDIKYSDSIINTTLYSKHEAYPTNGYLIKATLYSRVGDYSKALDNFIDANEWARKKKYEPLILEASNGIAAIKNVWGLHEEALEIYRKNYNDIVSFSNHLDYYYEDYILLANNLSLSYIRNHKLDSALYTIETAMKKAIEVQDTLGYYNLGKVQATANFYLKKYPQTQDSLNKFLPNYSGLVLSDSYYMLGKIAQYQNNYPLSILYFEKIDSIPQIFNEPFPELKEVYNELFKNASRYNDVEKQLYYVDRFIAIDSVLDLNYKHVNNKMRTDYDIPNFKKEKQVLIKKLDIKRKQLIISAVLALIVFLAFAFYSRKKQIMLKSRLEKLLETDVIAISEIELPVPKHETPGISEHIVKDILGKLEGFEKDKGYLMKDITLNSLAKLFSTNSTYLSGIVNQVKQTNFSSYLKDLRITNAINCIKKDNLYLKYSINGLADEFGFTTAESFSKAFREKTGIKPSYFLSELRK